VTLGYLGTCYGNGRIKVFYLVWSSLAGSGWSLVWTKN
jgi:hypothetical protein